jgi:hypothetical protein
MPPKRSDKFCKEHSSKFGLKVTSFHPNSGAVAACACRFCLVFCREGKVGEKRKKTDRCKYFQTFRTDHYLQHLRQQHPVKCIEYDKLETVEEREQERAIFKDVDVPLTNRLEAYFEREGVLRFLVSKPILEEVTGELIFHPDDFEGCTLDRALGIFKFNEPVDDELAAKDAEQISRDEYVAEIKTAKRFSLLVDCVALGSSFCMAARMVQLVRGESGLAIYSGCSELVTSNYTRVARAVC